MKVFANAFSHGDLPRGAIGTIGNYDGVHRGQRAILDRVTAAAAASRRSSAVITFEPHPTEVLRPDSPVPRLATVGQKQRLLAEAGIDLLFNVRFDRNFALISGETFCRDFLIGRLQLAELHVGSGFVFGRGRGGDLGLLTRLGREAEMAVYGVEEISLGSEPVSSTRIRAAVCEGRVEEASEMLGRPYSLVGTVVRGDGRGRELGWPTANLALESDLLPADGVYASRVRLDGAPEERLAVTNVGTRPTFDGARSRTVESHLFDFEGDLYGLRAEVGLCRRLRSERRFASVEELVAQIGRDAEAALEYFGARGC